MPDRSKVVWVALEKNGNIKTIVPIGTPRPMVGFRKAKLTWHVPNKKGMGRAKGNSLERETANLLSLWIYNEPKIIKRTPLSGGWASGKAGDVILDHEYERKGYYNPPVYVECRSYRDLLQHDFFTWCSSGKPSTLTNWINEVESKCDGRLPMLVLKGNNTRPWVLMMDRWLPEKVGARVMCAAPVTFTRVNRLGYMIPLDEIKNLGDGKQFFEDWREGGGSSKVRGLGRSH